MTPELKSYLKSQAAVVDKALGKFIPTARTKPATVHDAMRYSIFAGGKRLRPIICLAAAEACGGDLDRAMPAAAAVECIHTYSLIHDDLPCMDDDDLRRGMPTSHVKYGEGVAVLAGDALLTIAFEILAQTEPKPRSRYHVGDLVLELASASGSKHLIGGQIADLEGEGSDVQLTANELKFIHLNKTAALLTSSLRLGAMTANATEAKLDALTDFGRSLGLAFQVIDDILDVTQTTEKLGKSAGKDEATNKSTYPAIYGLEKSRKEAIRLTKRAHAALEPLGKKADRLHEIAAYLLDREF
ncbi:MAG: polyprenyl synthetase family protein [Verrucomicrobiota bacterium]